MIVLCSACTCRREELRCSDIEATTIKRALHNRVSLGFKRVDFVNVTWCGVGVDCRAFEGSRLNFEGTCARMIGPASSCRKVTIQRCDILYSYVRFSQVTVNCTQQSNPILVYWLVVMVASLIVICYVLFYVRRFHYRPDVEVFEVAAINPIPLPLRQRHFRQ